MRILIKSYSILLAIIGLISMLFFFPFSQGCSDCLPYSLCGLAMLILSIGLFSLNNFARKCMLWFSCIFVGFFILETIWLIKTDHTGQGLVGMVLLTPIFITCLIGIFLLLHSKIKREFNHITRQCRWNRTSGDDFVPLILFMFKLSCCMLLFSRACIGQFDVMWMKGENSLWILRPNIKFMDFRLSTLHLAN